MMNITTIIVFYLDCSKKTNAIHNNILYQKDIIILLEMPIMFTG